LLDQRQSNQPGSAGNDDSHRLTGAGMPWCPDKADRMLVIRAAVLSNDFDRLWNVA